MRISATLEHGTVKQVDACVPAAAALEKLAKQQGAIDEETAQAVLQAHPAHNCNHMSALSLPNLVQRLIKTCLAANRPGNRAIDPLGHVLNKAWPMRCSVRNFSDIVSEYIKTEPSIYRFVLIVLHASMLGVYPSSNCSASVSVRIMLHRCFQQDRLTPEQLAGWVRQNNHLLLFIAIKEYIAYAISLVPGLSSVLDDTYNWKLFVGSVLKQADSVRTTLNTYAGPPSEIFTAARDSIGTIRSYKCPASPADFHVSCEHLQAISRSTYFPNVDVFACPQRVKMYHLIAPLVQHGAPFAKIAAACGVDPVHARVMGDAVEQCSSAARWKEARSIRCADAPSALLLHEFVQAWIMCHQVVTYRLPAHVIEEQKRCKNVCGRVIYACACCRQLREFVVDSKSTNNSWACGHYKVLLDDCTGKVYCGKRVEKNTMPARRLVADNSRSFWKIQQSLMCGCCPLLQIDMDGYMLSFFGKLYVLCPSCGCVIRVQPEQHYAGSYRCINCRYRKDASQPDRCFHCYTVTADLKTIALQHHTVQVCNGCTRRWMASDSITCKIDEEVAHQAINERWSSSRLSVYCASI